MIPTIPPSVSFHKRVTYTHILHAIGKHGNFRSNINNKVGMSTSTVGHYLMQMKDLGIVERVVVPDGTRRGWISRWVWKESAEVVQ